MLLKGLDILLTKLMKEYEEQKRLAAAQSSQHNDSLSSMSCAEDEDSDTCFQMNLEDSAHDQFLLQQYGFCKEHGVVAAQIPVPLPQFFQCGDFLIVHQNSEKRH